MRIRIGTIISINIVAMIFMAIILIVTHAIINRSFGDLAIELKERQMLQFENELAAMQEDIVTITRDWAHWDDTYHFIDSRSRSYVESNFTPNTYENYKLNLSVIYDLDFNPVLKLYYDLEDGHMGEVSDPIINQLSILEPKIKATAEGHLSGILQTEEGNMLFGLVEVMQSDRSGLPKGYFLLGRFLSVEHINGMRGFVSVNIQAYDLRRKEDLDPQLKDRLDGLKKGENIEFASAQQIDGWVMVKDILDRDAFLVSLSSVPEVLTAGRNMRNYILLIYFFFSVLQTVVLYQTLNSRVIKRLVSVQEQLKQITLDKQHQGIVRYDGKDEIADLSNHINDMLLSLQKALAVKNEFFAGMSHEIRTPLNAVLGMSSVLMNTKLDERQQEYVEAILLSCESLSQLINDILDFSRLEYYSAGFDPGPFDLRHCVNSAIKIVRNKAEEKKLLLGISIDPDVPETVTGDKSKTCQILLNLLFNAIKFTDTGTIELKVTNDKRPGYIHFTVSDTGIGIPPDEQPLIFNPFIHISNSQNRFGSGLGLHITKKLVSLMDGEIGFESIPDRGTTFSFNLHLPQAETQISTADQDQKEDIDGKSSSEIRVIADRYPLQIMVVEDNPINLKMMLHLLAVMGYEPVSAINGKTALEMQAINPCDLIFMDIQLPVMDGYAATAEIRTKPNRYGSPIIIALTANALTDDIKTCLAQGMEDYIPKPIKVKAVSDMIIKWAETTGKGKT